MFSTDSLALPLRMFPTRIFFRPVERSQVVFVAFDGDDDDDVFQRQEQIGVRFGYNSRNDRKVA